MRYLYTEKGTDEICSREIGEICSDGGTGETCREEGAYIQ